MFIEIVLRLGICVSGYRCVSVLNLEKQDYSRIFKHKKNAKIKVMKENRIKRFNENSELNTSDVSRSFSIDDLKRAFEEGYKLYNNEGNKYMGFEVIKRKENMIQRAFNKFFDKNYD